jgi:hypothetical protein
MDTSAVAEGGLKMNRTPLLGFRTFLPIAGCLVMVLAPSSTIAQCPHIGAIGFEGIASVQGMPFQARKIVTVVTTGNDGAHRTQVTKSHVFRGAKGRVRVERFFDGTEDTVEAVPGQVIIYDKWHECIAAPIAANG